MVFVPCQLMCWVIRTSFMKNPNEQQLSGMFSNGWLQVSRTWEGPRTKVSSTGEVGGVSSASVRTDTVLLFADELPLSSTAETVIE